MDTLETPQWFKDELEENERQEREGRIIKNFEDRYVPHACDPNALQRVTEGVHAALERAEENSKPTEGLQEMAHNVSTGLTIQTSYIMTLAVAGLLYLVIVIDLIPDMIPGGFADDLIVLRYVWGLIKDRCQGKEIECDADDS